VLGPAGRVKEIVALSLSRCAVETASEREKLMFRVRAQLTADLLKKYMAQAKTGAGASRPK